MHGHGGIQRLVLVISVGGAVAVGAALTTPSSAQLPFDPYGRSPDVGPSVQVDRTGPLVPARGATTSTRSTKAGSFVFTFGPFAEEVTGKATFASTKAFAAAKRRRLSLGTKRFTGFRGERVRVHIRLSKRARKALKRVRAIRIGAAVKVSDQFGNISQRSYTFVLKAPRR